MATGKKRLWAREVDSDSWEDLFGITTGASDLMTVSAQRSVDGSGNNVIVVNAVYNGSSGITLSNYNGLPVGSVIVDVQAFKIHMKTAATTWKSSAAMT